MFRLVFLKKGDKKTQKLFNIGSSKEEIESNIKTLNPRKTPNDKIRYRTGTNPQGNDSHNFNSLNDSRGYHPIHFGPKSNSKSRKYYENERLSILPNS